MENKPVRTLSATEAKNRFGAVLREVARTSGPIPVERNGKAVVVILSVSAYEEECRRPLPLAPTGPTRRAPPSEYGPRAKTSTTGGWRAAGGAGGANGPMPESERLRKGENAPWDGGL